MPLRHVTMRHARAGCSAARALIARLSIRGAKRRRVRRRPFRTSGVGAARAGVPLNTVSVDETPNAYGSFALYADIGIESTKPETFSTT